MTIKVFVYGTLKRNEPNHTWLRKEENGTAIFIGEGVTRKKYPLIIATRYNVPFILYKPDVGHNIKGEVYDVDEKMLSKLDILEDYPHTYVREIDDILMRTADKEETIKCWVYFMKNFKDDLLSQPVFEQYSSSANHGLKYVEVHEQDPNFDFTVELR